VQHLLRRAPIALAALAVLLLAAATAVAAPVKRNSADRAPFNTKFAAEDDAPSGFSGEGAHQHGGDHGHLPASSQNVELVGSLGPSAVFGPIVEGQIADLSVYKDYAYLNSWSEPSCSKGGIYVVDVSNPRRPVDTGVFLPALSKNYHGEGAHVISVSTRDFTGDLLAVNNETCASTDVGGGFDLYDVSDPRNPEVLVQGAGDFGGEGQMVGQGTKANEYHSVFLWKDDGRVYLVGTDNEEFHDVDIFDVSNPRDPRPVNEIDMLDKFPQIAETPSPYGNEVFNHDMVVKEIGGRDVLLDSYWDGGYLLIDVENPASPKYIGDVDFTGGKTDPLHSGNVPPEGNAHQAEFSADNKYFLAADEDFNPYRADKFFIDGVEWPAAEVGGGTSQAALPDQELDGPLFYGGYGCPQDPTDDVPDAPTRESLGLTADQERILVLQRGPFGDPTEDYDGDGRIYDDDDACFPGDKASVAFDHGWDAILLVNRHPQSGDPAADEPYCGSGGYDPSKPMVTLCTTHEAFHELFNPPPRFESPYEPGDAPEIGTRSTKSVRGTSRFDGWGYAHLFRNEGGKVREVDAYAIPEALDESYAFGFGDLSIHEFAADPKENLAYVSYYSGGMRVFRFGESGLTPVGHYIAEDGNNFWGVETFVAGQSAPRSLRGKTLFAGSDRDHGIWIFRYTGG
jgi:hypothetical protein